MTHAKSTTTYTATKAVVSGVVTIAGGAVAAALQVFTSGPVSDALTVAAGILTVVGNVYGVYRASNKVK